MVGSSTLPCRSRSGEEPATDRTSMRADAGSTSPRPYSCRQVTSASESPSAMKTGRTVSTAVMVGEHECPSHRAQSLVDWTRGIDLQGSGDRSAPGRGLGGAARLGCTPSAARAGVCHRHSARRRGQDRHLRRRARLREVLVALDDERRRLVWTVVDGPTRTTTARRRSTPRGRPRASCGPQTCCRTSGRRRRRRRWRKACSRSRTLEGTNPG